MNNSKPKIKDQSSNKFFQRIAGKKAIGPPPTPRPIIGEHPVRLLLRENTDEAEQQKLTSPEVLERILEQVTDPSRIVEPSPVTVQSKQDIDISNVNNIEQPKSEGSNVESEITNVGSPSQQLETRSHEDSTSSKINAKTDVAIVKPKGDVGSVANYGSSEEKINDIRRKYRLNIGELCLYKELYLMTYAIGKTECSFVVSELVKSTGMLERRVRDNLRRLKKNGWIVQLEAYDFENREKAKYRVNVDPEI